MNLERQFGILGRRQSWIVILGFTTACAAAEEDGEDYDAYYCCDGDDGGLVDVVVSAVELVKARGLDVAVR